MSGRRGSGDSLCDSFHIILIISFFVIVVDMLHMCWLLFYLLFAIKIIKPRLPAEQERLSNTWVRLAHISMFTKIIPSHSLGVISVISDGAISLPDIKAFQHTGHWQSAPISSLWIFFGTLHPFSFFQFRYVCVQTFMHWKPYSTWAHKGTDL